MKMCYCRLIMAVIIIALVWMDLSWGKIAITALAAIIALISLSGGCCCKKEECKCEGKDKK